MNNAWANGSWSLWKVRLEWQGCFKIVLVLECSSILLIVFVVFFFTFHPLTNIVYVTGFNYVEIDMKGKSRYSWVSCRYEFLLVQGTVQLKDKGTKIKGWYKYWHWYTRQTYRHTSLYFYLYLLLVCIS